MNIMLLEDDVALNQTIKEVIESIKGCKVDSYYDGVRACENLTNSYNLFIIDINVPHIDGLEFLQFIKNAGLQTPTIIISADTNINTIAKAYNNGCNDFLKKPFHVDELVFKVKQFIDDINLINLGDGLNYDLVSKKLFNKDEELYLTKKESDMLFLLASNKGEIVTHEQIQTFVYNDQYVSNDSLRALVKRVRRVVGKDKIANHPSRGYKINLP